MQIIRYRIYQVIKWLLAGFSLVTIALIFRPDKAPKADMMVGPDMMVGLVLLSITWGVLAIFFKLQEDSNKPTI